MKLKPNKKVVIFICSVFLGGLISGLIFQIFVFPYLLANSYFSKFQFIKNFKEGKIIINTKEQIIVAEETALEKSIAQVEKSVVGIQAKTSDGTIYGSGLIVTSDGLIITLVDLAPAGANISVFYEGEKIKPQILKRDYKNNLALLKIEKTNLKTCGFCDGEQVRLGERVFLIGVIPSTLEKSANEGIIKTLNEEVIRTNITETGSLRGSPLFNIEGNLVGLNIIDSLGRVSAIPIQIIKTFAGF